MSYNTKGLLTDVNAKFISQVFNPDADAYRPLTGVDLGSGRHGMDILMWGKTTGGVYVPVTLTADGSVFTQVTGEVVTAPHTKPGITSNSSEVLPGNGFRKYALIQNISDVDIYLKFGSAAQVDTGILLPAGGGAHEMSSAYGNLYKGAIYGIHATVGQTKYLLVTEGA